jgi:hypothetical protein
MRTTPLRLHPDPDNTSGGNNRGAPRAPGIGAPGIGAAVTATGRANPHTGGNTDGQADTSAANPDVRTGEIRQDLMPDLDQPNGGTPNPT